MKGICGWYSFSAASKPWDLFLEYVFLESLCLILVINSIYFNFYFYLILLLFAFHGFPLCISLVHSSVYLVLPQTLDLNTESVQVQGQFNRGQMRCQRSNMSLGDTLRNTEWVNSAKQQRTPSSLVHLRILVLCSLERGCHAVMLCLLCRHVSTLPSTQSHLKTSSWTEFLAGSSFTSFF